MYKTKKSIVKCPQRTELRTIGKRILQYIQVLDEQTAKYIFVYFLGDHGITK